MLRHYDAIGLLRPADTDRFTGYRYYRADQLRRLNRLLALKDLGFTLDQVKTMLDNEVGIDELGAMLAERRADLADQIAADRERLGRIDARLRMIDNEGVAADVELDEVPPVQVTSLAGEAASPSHEDVSPVITRLFVELFSHIEDRGVVPNGPPIAEYHPNAAHGLTVRACCPVPPSSGMEPTRELPAMAIAARLRHNGPMATIGESYQLLATWIDTEGFRTDGSAREVYLVSHPEPQERWLTELQMPIERTI